jgi:hypothetical protein
LPDIDARRLIAAVAETESELIRAIQKHPTFNSPHEGWAVIKEELDELWEHCRANTARSSKARAEAKQVAAMALRFMVELT